MDLWRPSNSEVRWSVGDFLDQVVKQKELELAQKRELMTQEQLEARVAARSGDLRDFAGALRPAGAGAGTGTGTGTGTGHRIIAEIKRRSPSVPAFHQQGPVEELARIYEEGGAAAISVVTDTANFGMTLADVGRIRAASRLPVVVKDFIIDPYQVYEARANGADALLLIVRILSVERLTALQRLIERLGMAALVECHTEADLRKAIGTGARILGINNRNLADLSVSIDNTRGQLRILPRDVISVSESGIDHHDQIAELADAGVDAFLIGSALLQSADPGATLRALRGIAR